MNDHPKQRAPEYGDGVEETAPGTVVPATRARQAVTGHNVRYVLYFGIAAVVVAFLVVWLIYFG